MNKTRTWRCNVNAFGVTPRCAHMTYILCPKPTLGLLLNLHGLSDILNPVNGVTFFPGQSPTASVTLSDRSHTSSLVTLHLFLPPYHPYICSFCTMLSIRMLKAHAVLQLYCQLVHPEMEKSYSQNISHRVHLHSCMETPRPARNPGFSERSRRNHSQAQRNEGRQ